MPDHIEIIKNGSKSFSLAGSFFPETQWEGACRIYHWCRYCDDEIDNSGGESELAFLRRETENVLDHNLPSSLPAFKSIAIVFKKYNIPSLYAHELLNGMEMDIKGRTYKTMKELELYCYRVASTVGLMMCYVMGLFNIKALEKAAHLGMAMQLTNISRDIKEDFLNGRVYLPMDYMDAENVHPETLLYQEENTMKVVRRILAKADDYYRSGLSGLIDLPIRSAFVILVAALFYRQIGLEITTLQKRAVVPLWKKILLIMKAMVITILSIPERIRNRKEVITINEVWRPV